MNQAYDSLEFLEVFVNNNTKALFYSFFCLKAFSISLVPRAFLWLFLNLIAVEVFVEVCEKIFSIPFRVYPNSKNDDMKSLNYKS